MAPHFIEICYTITTNISSLNISDIICQLVPILSTASLSHMPHTEVLLRKSISLSLQLVSGALAHPPPANPLPKLFEYKLHPNGLKITIKITLDELRNTKQDLITDFAMDNTANWVSRGWEIQK